MSKMVLGLDLGSNSIGWALLEQQDGKPNRIINLGSRIFIKAVEEKTPTPKNAKRRNARLIRRVLQRRARRKQKMLNYLLSLKLLPDELQDNYSPEAILNSLGNPYKLRAKGLDQALTAYELGRVLLHLVQRRGFLSNRKVLLGDMVDDPDVIAELNVLEESDEEQTARDKEETAFKKDIAELRATINQANCRTLGEYLATLDHHDCKRNRLRSGGHLRTDRQMYREELALIWEQQIQHHPILTEQVREKFEQIIFYQRPIKLKADRLGKCSLEPKRQRANIARLESQRFRYLQDINNLQYFENQTEQWLKLNPQQREKLIAVFEAEASISFAKIRKTLGLDKSQEINLERGSKKLKGNITACEIRKTLSIWDDLSNQQQLALVEDLLTFEKKSALKKRLINHWQFTPAIAVNLCLLEFEPGHSNLSTKAINALLPYLQQGQLYSDARISAGYGYEVEQQAIVEKLGKPPETANPIVRKGLHELKRLVNAIIAEYGKPDAIRVEMARDLEMNTKRYAEHEKQQKANTKANDDATAKFQEQRALSPHLALSHYPSKTDKIKYRLWLDQNRSCAYSCKPIELSSLFGPEIEIDHILPYSESLDDSYMNKVVCYTKFNRQKAQQTPIDAFSSNPNQWNQITQALKHWDRRLTAKKNRFYMTAAEVQQRDFISSQLNDTRYISRLALDYLKPLGSDISVSKGITTAWVRHQWGLNDLIGDDDTKDRSDHRHHAIDAVVIACIDRKFYRALVNTAKDLERKQSQLDMRDIHIDPVWPSLRHDLQQALSEVIIAHAPQLKLTGELHEVTGAGFIEGVGNVNRKNLDVNFSQVEKIVDPHVKAIVEKHLQRFNNKPKQAFAEGNPVYHKDGKTPIKRVRIVQSKTTLDKLQKTKFGARNRQGEIFKWLPYGNLHHVEILKDKTTGKYSGEFITTMLASQRAKGIGQDKQAIIKTDHGENIEFVMALHINDIVSVVDNSVRVFYRVQNLDSGGNRFILRLHTAAKLDRKEEEIFFSINDASFEKWQLQKHTINVIGKLL
jgi:CRISPR-associated endonuclease Csn1